MNPFPREDELLSIFESEPIVLDKELPFYYNHLIYQLRRNNGELYVEIEPGMHWSRMIWKQEGKTIIDLELENIKGLQIERRNENEYLHYLFREETEFKTLIVKTKPTFSMAWGTAKR